MDKKEFQKMVKSLRKEGEEFPKAMMFGSQIRKRTATINCGKTSRSSDVVERILTSSEFDDFVKEQNVKHRVEKRLDSFDRVIEQIRIYW